MRHLRRRSVVGGGLGAAAGLSAASLNAAIEQDWAAFERRFVLPEGRVVDTGNRNVSHSEGQGYGLYAAARANDRNSFERILTWTLSNLRRSRDALFAWRWQPDTTPHVTDLNNATDGDLFIAWALLTAAERWNSSTYRDMGRAVARDVLRLCVEQVGPRRILLPGVYGFKSQRRVVVNPSYYSFRALQDLARHMPDPTWAQLELDGLELLRDSRFGMWQLPPDWLELPRAGGRPLMADGWPKRFSYDAIRIPLHLCWGGHRQEATLAASADFWFSRRHREIPAWTDLMTNVVAPYPAPHGTRAIARLVAAALAGRGDIALVPSVASAPDYYSAALVSQARLAWQDVGLGGEGP
nr:glycosyl hydrolase family 8 [uncultured Roseococcus sp.]